MIVAGSASPLLLSSAGGYNLTNSLRFRSSASAYLNRTPSVAATSTTKGTISIWFKGIGQANQYLVGKSSGTIFYLYFNSSNQLVWQNGGSNTFITTQVFRDPSSWYHLVASWDTTQATSSNRQSLYLNGQQITAFGTTNNLGLNATVSWFDNDGNNRGIGTYISGGYFDGYMAEINMVDGQALTPSSFGETSTTTGVWIPKKYTGTYGTNGFYLPFTDNSALTTSSNAGLGKDFSGNSNYWTTNNISITSGTTYDSMTDVPTLTSATAANFCTLNPISNPNGTIVTYSDGNLAFSHSASSGNAPKMTVQGTMALPAGKFYWEYTVGATVNDQVGIGTMLVVGGSADGTAGARYLNGGTFQSSYTTPSSAASYTTGDVIGMAYDQPNGTLAFYKNNSLQGTVTNISTSEVFFPLRSPNTSGSGGAGVFNFGQRPFTYTPPTGFIRLNTTNLPTPTIGATASTQANKYMDVLTWTGNGASSRAITGLNFQPDWVWDKMRSDAYQHAIVDSVRGGNQVLHSNSTSAEDTNWGYGYVSSFDSNGFTIQAGSASSENWNLNAATFVAWNWNAGGSTVTNTTGSISSQVRASTTAGFSIVTYTGTGSNATVGHGLGVAPSMIITKSRNDATYGWTTYHISIGAGNIIFLDTTNASTSAVNAWNNTAPTSSVFSLGTDQYANFSTKTYVAYCFAQVAGYSAFGSYTGNGSTDGPFVFCGFRPRYLMIKRTDSSNNWVIQDTSRDTYNVSEKDLYADTSGAEATYAAEKTDILSNGFKQRQTGASMNASGGTYIYMAFCESPFKFSNAR